MSEKLIREWIRTQLIIEDIGAETLKVTLDGSQNSWDKYDSGVPLSGSTGVGPGENRLVDIFGGTVQGGNTPYDLEIKSGPLKGKWEVKAPDKSGSIRPGTEGVRALAKLMRMVLQVANEMNDLINIEGVASLSKEAGASTEFNDIKEFLETQPSSRSEKTGYDMLTSGELTKPFFDKLIIAIDNIELMSKKMQGDLMNITVGDQEYEVTPAKMLKISRLLGSSEEEATGKLGEAAAAAQALSTLNSKVWEDKSTIQAEWDAVTASQVFGNVDGLIFVTPQGFHVMKGQELDSKLKLHRVTQGKPRFKSGVKGVSGESAWA